MALVVEDGTIVQGADSYVSLLSAQEYLTERGDDTVITEEHLRDGFDYINHFRLRFKGFKRHKAESNVQWPRRSVIIDNAILDQEIIPDCVIFAQIEAAVEVAKGRPPLETLSTRILSEKTVGPITKKWDTTHERGREQPDYNYRKVKAFLYPVLRSSAGLSDR